MTFGDLSPTSIAGLDGSIAFFALYKERIISDSDTKLHHHILYKIGITSIMKALH